jgi:membrane protein implicated in regulation of membrane protease activity
MENAMVVWLIILIILLAAELFTAALVSVWLALGAFFALISTFFGATPLTQIIVFLVVAALSLLATRPIVKRIRSKRVSTNADRNIGQIAVVTEDIDNIAGSGAARVDGKEWTARTEKGDLVAAGSHVLVLRIEGVKLIVSPAADDARNIL